MKVNRDAVLRNEYVVIDIGAGLGGKAAARRRFYWRGILVERVSVVEAVANGRKSACSITGFLSTESG
jgi:hypothetical protein